MAQNYLVNFLDLSIIEFNFFEPTANKFNILS